MKFKKVTFLLALVILNVSCSSSETETAIDEEPKAFITYIDQIPELQLPIIFDCGVFIESV